MPIPPGKCTPQSSNLYLTPPKRCAGYCSATARCSGTMVCQCRGQCAKRSTHCQSMRSLGVGRKVEPSVFAKQPECQCGSKLLDLQEREGFREGPVSSFRSFAPGAYLVLYCRIGACWSVYRVSHERSQEGKYQGRPPLGARGEQNRERGGWSEQDLARCALAAR